ncbi:hypothetical protein AAFH68_30670 [Flavobacterium sp. CGRL1]
MKTIKIAIAGLFLLVANATQAQVSINVNIGTPPAWGPAGYSEMEYYYLPDIEAYYDVRASQFIYFGRGKWVRTTYLPRQYRNYDLYGGYKVVLTDYHGRTPYVYFDRHKVKYYRGYHVHRKDLTNQDRFTDIMIVMTTEITNIMTNMINTMENTTNMTMMIIDTEVLEEDNIKLLSFNSKRVSKLLILSFF